MPIGDMLFISMVIIAFGIFAVVLGAVGLQLGINLHRKPTPASHATVSRERRVCYWFGVAPEG